MINIKFKKLNEGAIIPKYSTDGSAAFDFYVSEDIWIDIDRTEIVKTGLAIEIPKGYYLEIYPRSSTGLKSPLRLANSVGIIDSDYRGEIGLIFTNTGNQNWVCKKGDRLAQGIIKEIVQCNFIEVNELSETERNTGGYGSTGK